MNIRNTYWILSLCVLLSLSLALPYCCHTDLSELFSHQTEMASHASHGQNSDAQQCDCGHEFVKDYQKTKKVAHSQTFLLSSVVALQVQELFPVTAHVLSIPKLQPGILNDPGPPIHLLNSIFLN